MEEFTEAILLKFALRMRSSRGTKCTFLECRESIYFSYDIKPSTEHQGDISQATTGRSGFALESDVCESRSAGQRLVEKHPDGVKTASLIANVLSILPTA